ncbi:MAG: hypothetical protein IKB55_05530 [Clostridia bacterium]|nr:hypothetical protein [Clostridia bacterium]
MSEFTNKINDFDNDMSVTEVRDVNVCVPITITPDVHVGNIRVKPIGKSEVSNYCSCSREEASCSFAINQKFRVEVPVDFDVKVSTDETYIDCDCNSGNCCEDKDW